MTLKFQLNYRAPSLRRYDTCYSRLAMELTESQAAKYGGHSEYEAMIKFHDNPKTPQEKIAAM